jgi:hypothetical protein
MLCYFGSIIILLQKAPLVLAMGRGEQIVLLLAAHNLIDLLDPASMNLHYFDLANVSREMRRHFTPIAKAGLVQFFADLKAMRSGTREMLEAARWAKTFGEDTD